ncbi:MAG: hypoxanthine phosphoribosyltransferase [Thermorudis peleae]|nr:hypoxanthine phosphoribosyltransferase [Thermorudis peleae]
MDRSTRPSDQLPAPARKVLQAVATHLKQAQVEVTATLVVGFSGGPDSLTLLWALAELERRGQGPRIVALHVDHQLRPESADEARQAQALGAALGVPVQVTQVDVTQWAAYHEGGIEAGARAARYGALGKLAKQLATPWVAVAHTRDDQAETVLLRLISGASLEGLAGMRYCHRRPVALDPSGNDVVELSILRPLLDTSRAEIHACLMSLGLTPIDDPSNTSLAYRRNRIRYQVLPVLEDIAPGATGVIARVAMFLQDDADYLAHETAQYVTDLVRQEKNVIWVERQRLVQLPVAIQRRVLLAAVQHAAHGRQVRVASERLEALRNASAHAVGAHIELGHGLLAYVDYTVIAIGHQMVLERALRSRWQGPLLLTPMTLAIQGHQLIAFPGGWILSIDAAEPVTLRTRHHGDRLRVSTDRLVRLQDWLVNEKIPRYLREWLPVVARDKEVLWIAGVHPAAAQLPGASVQLISHDPTIPKAWQVLAEKEEQSMGDIEPSALQAGLAEVLIDEQTLQRRVTELGAEIAQHYAGKRPLLIGVLSGAFVFMADLVRHMPIPLSIDFMAVSSYGKATVTSGVVRILKDLDRPIEGEDVLLVEDIVDSGLTLQYLSDVLRRRNPASLRVVALLRKQKADALPVPVDWVGFEIPDVFVVGYGLDVAGKYRNLPFVAIYRAEAPV